MKSLLVMSPLSHSLETKAGDNTKRTTKGDKKAQATPLYSTLPRQLLVLNAGRLIVGNT